MPISRSPAPAFSASIGAGTNLSIARRFPAGAVECAGQFRLQRAMDGGVGGITLGEATGWFGALRWRYISSRPLTEDGAFRSAPLERLQRPDRLPLRRWLAHPARRPQSVQHTIGPGRICLRLAAQERQLVRPVLSGERRIDSTGRRLPERRHGLRAASDGAARGAADLGEDVLDRPRRADGRRIAAHFAVLRLLSPSSKKPLRFVML